MVGTSELTALIFATAFPAGKGAFDIVKRRSLNPVSILVLLGIGATAAAVLLGGSPRLLLLRESIFTGALGLVCLVSLVILPRPLMFYFGYHFLVRGDPVRRRRYEASWALPEVRRASRLITFVWGAIFVGEFGIRVALVFTLSTGWVLAISPVLLGSVTVATVIWTFRYARRTREEALPKI